ncbi:flagellar basal-body MS-ring/collar protein FliF [Pelomonas aquatica]|jgi:flagellar M-ring protein FliF|uniref:Flagellar M-ring protein n=1 Tax=Pelomonas aquatica TaxID=431058 RepID=A0A9X4R5D5_9BURK|nr:flagellar basal-body MS-ring/collar protein FliF [Pelomonas aquatica]MCY4756232.1 flagellar basal-body MS-ring/collar protein FliF [Pelomonas aquatica]MDG0863516.1 flagellar basal body M-ring protein FliF [Pelomonas aquatica]
MDTALSAPAAAAPVMVAPVEAPNLVQRINGLPLRSKLAMGAGLLALAGAVLAITLWSSQGDYRPLFTGLADKDGGAVIGQLAAMNVPYKHEAGGTILVPAGQVYELRMKLAAQGLPKSSGGGSGGTVGFELMDKSSIGQTQFNERLNFQRALEGELTRTITAMSDVADARVHLAIPQQNGFFREQQKPSASVMLTLRGGRTLDRAQIAGIVHLVSSSVPELSPKAVSVLDQTGALLSQAGADGATGLDSQQLQYKQQVEAGYNKRILELLEPVVGRDNLRATVTADVDFSQTEATAEEYRPNQGANTQASVRSSQSSEQTNANAAQPTGVPGAATNQPPVPATAPVNGASAPLQAAQGSAGTNGNRREQVTNYELDKTVRVTRGAVGNVKRLSAAIVVNQRTVTDAKGKTTTQPVPDEEITRLTELVKEAMGFSSERGDSVKVVSAPFVVDKTEPADLPLWKQPWLTDLLRSALVPAACVLIALIAVFGMIRPAIKAAAPPPPPEKPETVDEIVDDAELLPGPDGMPKLEAPVRSEKLDRARALARDNPVAVANIVRDWMAGETI